MTAIARIITLDSNKLIEETEFEDVNELAIRKIAKEHIKLYKDQHELNVRIELIYLDRKYGQAIGNATVV